MVRSKGKAAQAIPEMFMLPPDAKAQLTGEARPLLTSLKSQLLRTVLALHQSELCGVCPSSVPATAAGDLGLEAHAVPRPSHV